MSDANIAFIQSLSAAFQRGDIAAITAASAPQITWEVNGRVQDHPLLGLRQGPRGVQDFFETVVQVQDMSEFSPCEFYADGEKVFVLGHYAWTIRRSGWPVASNFVHIFTVRDGKLTAFVEFTDTAKFADAYRGTEPAGAGAVA